MAIYHFSAKIISRAKGDSAIAAAAYRSASRLTNEYDGQVHDYRRKQHVTRSVILLPDNAPDQYSDRQTLWNAVELSEKSNAQLAREIEFSLPKELEEKTRERIALEFIQETFVNDCMIADVSFHNPPKRDARGRSVDAGGNITKDPIYNNPHVHVLLTLRPINENGKWENKKQKLYVCEKDGQRKSFAAGEIKTGWEKLYSYIDETGKKYWYTKSYASEHPELSLVNRYPKSESRMNPKVEKWNSPESLKQWRAAWAEKVNTTFIDMDMSERIDHRSYKEQGLDLIPTVHMGKRAVTEERRLRAYGGHTELYKLNQAIQEHNAEVRLLMELRRLKELMEQLLLQASKRISVAARSIAEKLERLRAVMIITSIRKKQLAAAKEETEERIRMTREYLLPQGNDQQQVDEGRRFCSVAAAVEIEKLEDLSRQSEKRITALNKKYSRAYREYQELDTQDEEVIKERIRIRPDIEAEYTRHISPRLFQEIALGYAPRVAGPELSQGMTIKA